MTATSTMVLFNASG